MADHARYYGAQLRQYFNRIQLPAAQRVTDIGGLSHEEQVTLLGLLVKHSLVTVPFENLTQHYSWHRVVDVSPRHVFRKIVGDVHNPVVPRGGYCMENNTLLHTVLYSLRYKVHMAGARVYEPDPGRYGGFSHCVNIVTIGDARYVVDVGFGAPGPITPLPLDHGRVLEGAAAGGKSMRVVREAIPQQVDQEGSKVWILQHPHRVRNTGDDDEEWDEWKPLYCFVDFEFLLEDIQAMNLGPWRSPHSWFTQKVVLSRFTTDREVDGEGIRGPYSANEEVIREGNIDGALVLFQDTLKWRRGGELKIYKKLENEQQRTDAMWKYFGIKLDEEDREAIKGTVGELAIGVTM
ncbi:arylamine N-acetyltransferase 3 [Whalleya microplaca]|nr:arylamine N-acetyltransferase 3 [Whalleya microplaca]